MRTLIAYATKSGASGECAEILAEKIGDCTLWNLEKGMPNPDDYDFIIIGTGIHVFRAYRPFREFLDKNKVALLSKKTAFYICSRNKEIYQQNIPEDLRNSAVIIKAFGGKSAFRKEKDQSWMLVDDVNAFAQVIKYYPNA